MDIIHIDFSTISTFSPIHSRFILYILFATNIRAALICARKTAYQLADSCRKSSLRLRRDVTWESVLITCETDNALGHLREKPRRLLCVTGVMWWNELLFTY